MADLKVRAVDIQPRLEPGLGRQTIQTAILTASNLFLGILRGQEGVVFLDLIIITNSDIGKGSFILTASAIGFVIGTLLIGPLYDRFNNDVLFCICLLMTGVTTVIIPWCSYLPLMIAIFGLRGFFVGPVDTGSCVMITKTWRLQAGPYLQNMQFLFAVGGIIAPFITEPFLLEQHNITAAPSDSIWGSGANLSVIITGDYRKEYLILVPPLLNHTFFNESDIDQDELPAASEISEVYKTFLIAGGSVLILSILFIVKIVIYGSGDFDRFNEVRKINPTSEEQHLSKTNPLLKTLICYGLLAINSFSYGCVLKLMMGFVMAFVVEYLGWSKKDGSLITTIFWAGFAGGRFLGIFLVKFLKPKALLFLTFFGELVTCGLMILAAHLSWNLIVWWILIGISGMMLAPVFASRLSWLDRALIPVTGKLVSFVFVCDFVGTTSHVALLGFLFDQFIPLWFLYLMLIHSAICCLTFVALSVAAKAFKRPKQHGITLDIPMSNLNDAVFCEKGDNQTNKIQGEVNTHDPLISGSVEI